VPTHQFLNPLLSSELGGVVGLHPIPITAIQPAEDCN
jgi:hypothetical protein